MPKKTKRNKAFYVDTNVVLDYITGRNTQTISVLEKIKSRGWKCISSSFLTMEVADYRKDSIFLVEKALEKRWEMRRIVRETYQKDLKRGDFEKVLAWFVDFLDRHKNLDLYDFLTTKEDWFVAQHISFNSNLNAPDSVHLASAILGAQRGYCQILMTNDAFFAKEATKIIETRRLKSKLRVMTVAEVEHNYFTRKNAKPKSN
ncbi:MAG: hypothetical protein A3D65_00675 [Candidatus Lloydbacteria bacterium RIFCSPHIGHO2_02_FULL_50_13]|uniref:PIN domain-containing protein n=1 Tax=Candidatus Lloydbacteria bacterium RIFCSPHIGHO2_02_FULL_50_13 TaxID=1798661 RepID=A0A1G2DCD5_9BACT|nr:MAG: hypothetical protein A3D65_00675 [Candidatus Lloydbacteria bacterium RIFCSPHIGHO2_02_FULL_50_13]